MKKIVGATALFAGGLLLAAPAAQAAECGTPAQPAVYNTVHTDAVPATTEVQTIIDVPAHTVHHGDVYETVPVPAVPAVPGTPEEGYTNKYWVKITPAWTEHGEWVTEKPAENKWIGPWIKYMTRTVTDVAAVPAKTHEETVIDREAYSEQVVDVPEHVVQHPAKTHTVEHEAEYKKVYHEAEYKAEWKYAKHGGYGFIYVDNDTYKYVLADGTGTNYKPSHGSYYERTQDKRQTKVKDAWCENVLVKAAWDETVTDHEAWNETVPATYKTVYHDEITHQETFEDSPAVPAKTHQEFKFKRAHKQINEYKWAETSPGADWVEQGKTEYIMTKPATEGTPEIPATTREELVAPAYDEPVAATYKNVTVVVTPAIPSNTKKVLVKEAIPAGERCVAPNAPNKDEPVVKDKTKTVTVVINHSVKAPAKPVAKAKVVKQTVKPATVKQDSNELAQTGFNVGTAAAIAVALMLLGGGLVAVRKN